VITNIAQELLKRKANCGAVRIITIDGPAGSGKTTFAHHLASVLDGCPVVSMDFVYNGWNQALTDETWQRIIAQIITPMRSGRTASYEKFDWHAGAFTSTVEIPKTDVLIIEGVGAGHPLLRPYSALSIWIEADEKLLLRRVLERDGNSIRSEMVNWQKQEKMLFKKYNMKQSADYIITTS